MSTETVAKPCPVCGKPATPRHKPFCSQRCATIDLARWLTGGYRVPGEEVPKEGEEEEPQKD
jgi:endogenous inhibitor of DNA gyrase (YacG/DUF329 family)